MSPPDVVTAKVQLAHGPVTRARVRYTLGDADLTAPIPGVDDDITSGVWKTAVVHELRDQACTDAWRQADPVALWAAYRQADLDRWAQPVAELTELLTEFDDPAVVFLPRFAWHRATQPWTELAEAALEPLPQTYRSDADLFVVAVPEPASRWLSTYWSLPQMPPTMHLRGAANDSAKTFTLTLGLWQQTGGPMPSLSQALTTARHATFDVLPHQA